MNRKLAAAATLLLAAGLTGCASTTGSPGAAQTGSNRPAATSAVPVKPAAVEPAPPVEEDGPLTFGATKTYTDGLSVTISRGKAFKPSEYSGSKSPFHVKYTVTVVNGTGKMFDPGMFYATVQSSNVEAAQVFDSAKSIMGAPSTKLLKGREVKFVIGYGVENPKDIVMEVRPSFEYDPAIYN